MSVAAVAIQAALCAGEILRRGFQTDYKHSIKTSVHDVVTQFDLEAEKAIIATIKSYYPDHVFLAEESGGQLDPKKMTWIIDPLDGTSNFVHHTPLFSTSIAAYSEGKIEMGVIYQPMTHELFVAERGNGAFLNGNRIAVSKTSQLDEAFTFISLPSKMGNRHRLMQPLIEMMEGHALFRDLGSAALHLAYLAAGRADLFWTPSLQPWDMAAGQLLIEEAGGKVTNYTGKTHPILSESNLVASNKILHQEIVKILSN